MFLYELTIVANSSSVLINVSYAHESKQLDKEIALCVRDRAFWKGYEKSKTFIRNATLTN